MLSGQIQKWIGSYFGLGCALLAFSVIYCLAPNVEQKFNFITAGSVVGVVVLPVASLAFASYEQSFGNYGATYGSVGAVIVLMLWLYIAGLAILFGSEINALVDRNGAGDKQNVGNTIDQRKRNPDTR